MEEVTLSPLGNPLVDYIEVIDYTVSGRKFKVKLEEETGMLVTSPQPKDLTPYYDSKEYISHTDGKDTFFEKIYQLVKSYSLKNKLQIINDLTEGRKILDIGCGTGEFLKICEQNGWNTVGAEPNVKARTAARHKTQGTVYDSLFDEALQKEQFDVITLWHVLEHLPNLHQSIETIKSLLKPNGVLVVAIPNPNSYDAIHYGKYWAAYDVPRHLYHFTQKSVKALFGSINMTVCDTLPMRFDAYYGSLLSEQYKTGKKRWIPAVLNGLESNIKAIYTGEYSSLIYIIKNK